MTQATVYLHIGMNKTGTSALQRFFVKNQVRLAEHGVLYPVSGRIGDAHYQISAVLGFGVEHDTQTRAERALALWKGLAYVRPGNRWFGLSVSTRRLASQAFRLLHARRFDQAYTKASLRDLFHAEIAESGVQTVVCSSEFFVRPREIAEVRDFFGPLRVRIVVYLRRHDFWFASVYSQALKKVSHQAKSHNVADFINELRQRRKHRGRYLDLLNRWAAVFGDDAIIVRPYEKQQNLPNIAADFLRAIGRQDIEEKLDFGMDRVNQSISPQGLMLLEVFRRIEVEDSVRKRLIEHAVAQVGSEGALAMLSPQLRCELIAENASDYRAIARRYLGRPDGRLFYDAEPDPDAPWVPPPSLSAEELLQETIQALETRQ